MTDSHPAACEHCIGAFELRDARRLLAALEYLAIPFEIEEMDGIRSASSRGSYGQHTKIAIWVRSQDQEVVERVTNAVLKITT